MRGPVNISLSNGGKSSHRYQLMASSISMSNGLENWPLLLFFFV